MVPVGDVVDFWLSLSFFTGEEETVDEESGSSPLVETFHFSTLFLLFVTVLRFLLLVNQRIFHLIPVFF